MKKVLISATLLVGSVALMSFVKVAPNGDLQIGNASSAIFWDKVGRFQQANNWNFDPAVSQKGLILENGTYESSGIYLDDEYAVIWSPGDQGRLLRIYDEDAMYTGSVDYEKAYIDGVGNYFKASDEKRKKEINVVSDAVKKLQKIKGVNYKYKEDTLGTVNVKGKAANVKTAGLLAQEVETVIPEAVQTDKLGNKFMDYDAVIPYLVEAIKAQQTEIETLKTQLASIKK